MPSGVFVGLTVLDIVSRVSHFPSPNQKVTAVRQDIAAGGPAANAAVAFAALGGEATLISYLGESALAQIARADLESHNVRIIDCADDTFQLQASSITVSAHSGDRSIVSTDGGLVTESLGWRGASDQTQLVQALAKTDVLLIDGHHPELTEGILAHPALSREGNANVTLVADAGRWKPQFEYLLPRCTHVVASDDFDDPFGWVPRERSVRSTLSHETSVVRTRGAEPALWWLGDAEGEIASNRIEVVDTLGAGDIFHGAFSFAMACSDTRGEAQGMSAEGQLVRAIGFASQVAALKISRVGTREWITGIGELSAITH